METIARGQCMNGAVETVRETVSRLALFFHLQSRVPLGLQALHVDRLILYIQILYVNSEPNTGWTLKALSI
ncbi:hypothetical protein BABINDRAFT_137848 [Babjeviella inositovora NRRL Y-12698]|uniref:Uncharacterized protein n=1 Tax=Babjeviella inositovora NRRL Y-12698 TaxID=984486 RepID=A0A1E3QQK1_9ASCO|nr:uncharacterized protein BABINDRAFT_137848 [Babjeviella inositovora NRRL Y-12698]ODQ79963.1 hypothetical protein BABINDRAFT_137848 [Babjeviella inositovora NRRL Y-12698]